MMISSCSTTILSSTTRTTAWTKIKNQAESKGIESTSTETTSFVAVETARETGEEHSDRSTANVKADRIAGEGHHARYLHSVAEAGSILLHVSNNRNEGKKDGEDGKDGEEVNKCIKRCMRDKKLKRQQAIQRILEDFKGVSNIPGIKSAKKKVLITKIKNERGEIMKSRRGIANVFGEFHKKLYDDNEQDESEREMKAALTCTSATPMK